MLRQALVDAEAGQKADRLQWQQDQHVDQQQHSSTHQRPNHPDERRSLIDPSINSHNMSSDLHYGATQSSISEGPDMQSSSVQTFASSDDEADYLSNDDDDDDDEDDDDDKSGDDEVVSIPARIWNSIKNLVRVVADVENLWDSPPQPSSSSSYNYTSQSSTFTIQQRLRNQYIVLFWFVVLASSYAGERSTFKLLVDRAGPFRLFSVQVITVSHIILLGTGLVISYYMRLHQQRPIDGPIFMPLGIPIADCILMAILDTITLILLFVTGAHVPPTLTVILIQFTIPLTAFLTQFIHPDGKFKCCDIPTNNNSDNDNNNSQNENHHDERMTFDDGLGIRKEDRRNNHELLSFNDHHDHGTPAPPPIHIINSNDERLPGWGGLAAAHVYGSLILFLAVSLALCPAFYSIANPDFFIYADAIPTRTAINTIFFVISCFPAAASQLYKEHIFLQYRQPVNMGYLNFILSIFQFILVSVISPIAYGLQGLGFRGDWNMLYPASGTSDNFIDGWKCFFGLLDEDDQENKYPEDAECRLTLVLALLYVFSIIAVGVSVDKIVNAGATKVMYRGISAGIIVAVLSMHYYDMHITDFSYGPAIDALNLVCLLLLVIGAEVYHRSSLQESTFETVYPDISMPIFDE